MIREDQKNMTDKHTMMYKTSTLQEYANMVSDKNGWHVKFNHLTDKM